MSIDHHFCLERREGERWLPCRASPSIVVHADDPAPHRIDFTWLPRRSPALPLFYGELFDMHPGAPTDADTSTFFRHYAQPQWRGALEEMDPHWISVEGLFLDEWATMTVLMQGRAPASVAGAFGNGRGSFPARALTEAGVDMDAQDRITWRGHPVTEPIDQDHGHPAYERRRTGPPLAVAVTWSATMEGLLGTTRYSVFMGLADLGPRTDLRVIAYRG